MATALELGREGWKPYLTTARNRQPAQELTQVEQREREQLLERVQKAADSIKARFNVKRVVLFGSLAHAAWFVPDTDVDLAVEGLAGDDYWQAWRLVEEIVGDRSVDLVQLEMTGESLQRAIQRYGIEL